MRELTDAEFASNPLGGPAFFEAVVDDQGGRETRHGPIDWSDVGDWLNLTGAHEFPEMSRTPSQGQVSLRILYIPLGTTAESINMNRDTWTNVSSQFELHESTAEAFLDNNGAFGFYSYRAVATPHAIKRIKLVVKVANKIAIGYEALSLVFDLSNLTIRAVMHGAMPAQWDSFIRILDDRLHLCRHPLLLPTLIFVTHRKSIECHRRYIDGAIHQLEQNIGFGVAGSFITADHIPAQQVFKLDSALVKLQSQQTELAILSSISRSSKKLADFLLNSITRLDQALQTSDHGSIVNLEDEILHMLELPHNQARLALSQMQSLKERLQSQADLIFSLMSSEENKISRLVAEESAKVAVASKRDSVAMKTVAVLTMIFLPGTFVAAFLSMPLFEWNVETGGYPSSTSFQWIYWVITLPLTTALVVGCRVWWRMEERSWSSELEEAKQQNRQRLLAVTQSGQELTQISSDQTFSNLRARNLVARGF
ncbi:hypothetical protein SCAR479_04533 [Seiridium cardinale]|uniref:Uncharacterized protein n=1 Tax=Seiridium cardinale TaxID=138064 RepID=A0ABR2XXZ5_9PEZI